MVNVWDIYINNLKTRGRINEEMASMMKTMVNADIESATMVKVILKEKISEILKSGLNKDQSSIFDDAIEYLEENQNNLSAFMINGYAGTGKTFLIKRIIEYISACLDGKICITAPTNKAVKVLNEGRQTVFLEDGKSNDEVVYCTTHKYLGLKEYVDDEGNISFVPSGNNMSAPYLIIDEASMINKTIANIIMSNPKVKIILLGDPCQIPPVGEDKCIFFKDDLDWKICRKELKTIVRQKNGNPIIDKSIEIRENIKLVNPVKTTSKKTKNGSIVFTNNKVDCVNFIKENLTTDEFKEDASVFKVIAWRNETINNTNNFCRKVLFGNNAPKYVVGEKLIANNTIYIDGRYGLTPVINTSQEMTITDVCVIDRHITIQNDVYKKREDITIKSYRLEVLADNNVSAILYVVHDNDKFKWLKYMSDMKKECVKQKNSKSWICYYNIGKLFSDVNYAYAITAHKSQGSTYKNCLVMFNDIDKNFKVEERNKIKYTSVTRASNNIMVLC